MLKVIHVRMGQGNLIVFQNDLETQKKKNSKQINIFQFKELVIKHYKQVIYL